jgi:hypothetical protein
MLLRMQPTAAAITYGRQRLGWQVMERLLTETSGPLAGQEQQAAFVSGMRLAAADGMCLDLPDTPENAIEFGYPANDAGRGPFPQVRVVGLGECGTRAVLGAQLPQAAAWRIRCGPNRGTPARSHARATTWVTEDTARPVNGASMATNRCGDVVAGRPCSR